MTGFVQVLVLLLIGLALGIGFNESSIGAEFGLVSASASGAARLDMTSYAAGLLVGMLLWQVGSVPWGALPARLQSYLVSQVHFYQFMAIGAACVAVLIYF